MQEALHSKLSKPQKLIHPQIYLDFQSEGKVYSCLNLSTTHRPLLLLKRDAQEIDIFKNKGRISKN